jgi:hypothetical protein
MRFRFRQTVLALSALVAAPIGWLATQSASHAQAVDPKRARTFVVGAPRGPSNAERVDPGRTGFSKSALPAGPVHAEWRVALGSAVEHAPLVDDAGNVHVVVGRGDVVVVSIDGKEKSRVVTGSLQAGPAALTSDGTVVFVSASGEAIGVRNGAIRYRTRIGRNESVAPSASPLPLGDGGVAVATPFDLALLDAEGNVRARALAPESLAAPLVSALGRIVCVGASGAVYTWQPGRDPSRVGSFGAPIDGAAALSDDHTLIAVANGHVDLVAVDLVRGTNVTRASAVVGALLGPPTMRGTTTFLIGLTPTSSSLLAIDGTGQPAGDVGLTTNVPLVTPDGGPPPLVIPPHGGTLVDAAGTVAFIAPDGQTGVVHGSTGTVELVTDVVCSRSSAAPSRPGLAIPAGPSLAPAGPGAFVVGCANGALVRIALSGLSRSSE